MRNYIVNILNRITGQITEPRQNVRPEQTRAEQVAAAIAEHTMNQAAYERNREAELDRADEFIRNQQVWLEEPEASSVSQGRTPDQAEEENRLIALQIQAAWDAEGDRAVEESEFVPDEQPAHARASVMPQMAVVTPALLARQQREAGMVMIMDSQPPSPPMELQVEGPPAGYYEVMGRLVPIEGHPAVDISEEAHRNTMDAFNVRMERSRRALQNIREERSGADAMYRQSVMEMEMVAAAVEREAEMDKEQSVNDCLTDQGSFSGERRYHLLDGSSIRQPDIMAAVDISDCSMSSDSCSEDDVEDLIVITKKQIMQQSRLDITARHTNSSIRSFKIVQEQFTYAETIYKQHQADEDMAVNLQDQYDQEVKDVEDREAGRIAQKNRINAHEKIFTDLNARIVIHNEKVVAQDELVQSVVDDKETVLRFEAQLEKAREELETTREHVRAGAEVLTESEKVIMRMKEQERQEFACPNPFRDSKRDFLKHATTQEKIQFRTMYNKVSRFGKQGASITLAAVGEPTDEFKEFVHGHELTAELRAELITLYTILRLLFKQMNARRLISGRDYHKDCLLVLKERIRSFEG